VTPPLASIRARLADVDPDVLTHRRVLASTRLVIDGLPVLAESTCVDACTRMLLVQDAEGFWPVEVMDDDPNSAWTGVFSTITDALLTVVGDVDRRTREWRDEWHGGSLAAVYLDSTHPLVEQVRVVLALASPKLPGLLATQAYVVDNLAHWDALVEAFQYAINTRGMDNPIEDVLKAADHPYFIGEMLLADDRDNWWQMAHTCLETLMLNGVLDMTFHGRF
jgi:hypothetical protein